MHSHLLSCRHLDLFEIKFFSCPQSFRSIILCDNSSFPTPSNFAHPLPFYAVMEKVLMPKNMPKSSALLVFHTTSIHCITFRMLRLKLTLSLTILMLTLTLMTLLTITILHQQQCGVKMHRPRRSRVIWATKQVGDRLLGKAAVVLTLLFRQLIF